MEELIKHAWDAHPYWHLRFLAYVLPTTDYPERKPPCSHLDLPATENPNRHS